MKNPTLFGIATAVVLTAPSIEAATVIFNAGSANVLPSASFDIPVTCEAFTDVTSFQFSLSWDPGSLQFNSVGDLGMGTTAGMFTLASTGSGRLGLAWDPASAGPETYAEDTTIFTINFTALGSSGTSSSLQFGDNPTSREVSVNFAVQTFSGQNGTISVVPEPAQFTLVSGGLLLALSALRSARLRLLGSRLIAR